MKRIIVLLLLAAIVAPAFADDALVLPKGVLRTRIAPSVSFGSQEFDKDGEKQDIGGGAVDSFSAWNLAAALEYGVTDEINVALQWAPGWNMAASTNASSDLPDPNQEAIENAKNTGLYDLFVGAKAQILGSQGFVPNETMRLAGALGFIVPLSVYDPDEAGENAAEGKEYQAGRLGNDTFATGFRLYYDYVISEAFYWNLFTEFKYFFPRDLDQGGDVTAEVAPGFELTLETEPHYEMPVGDGMVLTAGLPLTFDITGESEVEGTAQKDSTNLFKVSPTIGLNMRSLPLPTDVSLSYTLPVFGSGDDNASVTATNTVALQIKNYLRF